MHLRNERCCSDSSTACAPKKKGHKHASFAKWPPGDGNLVGAALLRLPCEPSYFSDRVGLPTRKSLTELGAGTRIAAIILAMEGSKTMRVPRFSIRTLLMAIAISGVGLAMLRSPSPVWASATYTVATVAIIAGAQVQSSAVTPGVPTGWDFRCSAALTSR